MQFASAGHFEGIRAVGGFHKQAHVDLQFLFQSFLDVARRDVFALFAGERRRVDHEIHGQRRFFDADGGQRIDVFLHAKRVADRDVGDAGYDADIAAADLVHSRSLQASVHERLVNLAHFIAAVGLTYRDLLARSDRALRDAADAQSSDVVVVGQRGDLELQRFRVCVLVAAHLFDNGLEQRRDVQAVLARSALPDLRAALAFHGDPRSVRGVPDDDALAGDAVQDGEIQLAVVCFQIHEQLVDLVHDFVDTGVLLVDLIDQQNRVQVLLQGFLQHETGLRHGSFGGIHQKDDRIHRLDDALDLGREVRVARRIHDIDLVSVVHDGTVLGIDGDASFALQVVGVHGLRHHLLVFPEYAALRQECVHQGGLTGVDVGDHSDIDDLFLAHNQLPFLVTLTFIYYHKLA